MFLGPGTTVVVVAVRRGLTVAFAARSTGWAGNASSGLDFRLRDAQEVRWVLMGDMPCTLRLYIRLPVFRGMKARQDNSDVGSRTWASELLGHEPKHTRKVELASLPDQTQIVCRALPCQSFKIPPGFLIKIGLAAMHIDAHRRAEAIAGPKPEASAGPSEAPLVFSKRVNAGRPRGLGIWGKGASLNPWALLGSTLQSYSAGRCDREAPDSPTAHRAELIISFVSGRRV